MSQITPHDIRDAVAWITSRWPASVKDWSDWESFAADYANFSLGSLKEALHIWHRRGERQGPNTSQLSRLVAEVHASRVERGAEEVDRSCLGHVWANPWSMDEDRHMVCALCGEAGPLMVCTHPVRNDRGNCVYCPETTSTELRPVDTAPVSEALI